MPISQTEGYFKNPSNVFRRIYAPSVGFKIKTLKKSFSSVKTKTNPNFAVKLAESSNHSFLLSIWWSIFLKHLNSLIRVIMEFIELNWLCKHTKKVRRRQAVVLVLNWLYSCEYIVKCVIAAVLSVARCKFTALINSFGFA